ncbi:hypothetical protein BACCOPRO_00880 [Phocaeicola coprophilus DSM 18228 = JCM 13818]|uniref:Uncharacterized protein n=1 Tax=Phocaeicola coprophilus DSM 18228 = JCM 13818 TaxID=547042 RepID=S0FA12_9BACT|nr:hypothetical protein BACCOPRO_00880 [Phocaeicola coprophilus DSM 18228 = JCM 13818]
MCGIDCLFCYHAAFGFRLMMAGSFGGVLSFLLLPDCSWNVIRYHFPKMRPDRYAMLRTPPAQPSNFFPFPQQRD